MQRPLIHKITELARVHGPRGIQLLPIPDGMHLVSPGTGSWIHISNAKQFNRWELREYRTGRQPIVGIADSDWQILTWLIARWLPDAHKQALTTSGVSHAH